ncbi:MAG TPA: RES family NAD+ phosphorylase [Bryobacteraceae bacterium]|nr:RES family NAD+ phosphorylase [Bryobacteraceae bacterium]
MILWRISRHEALDGFGGLMASARWHTAGHRIVYLADSPASALLETLVHLELGPDLVPDGYRLLKIDAPENVSRETINVESLGPGWEFRSQVTRALGDPWLRSGTTALVGVPSALVPETGNWLLNPQNPDAQAISILWARPFPFDDRFFRFAR